MQEKKIIEQWGQDMFLNILREIESCSKKWQLFNLEFYEHYSINAIFFCKSEIYGDCVLKIGGYDDEQDFTAQYNVLREYNGGRCYVKAYDVDIDSAVGKKATLIERVFPGIPLRNEQSLDKRLVVFSELFDGLHIAPAKPELYFSHIEFLKIITSDCLKENTQAKNLNIMIEHADKARELYFNLSEKYNKKMLLHMDLYWGNIISGSDGRYMIIDPKGVIGDPVFDMGVHLKEECFKYMEQPENIDFMFDYFEKSLNIPNKVLRQIFYIEAVRVKCEHHLGLNDEDIRILEFAENIMNE
jgi:hypothetical protein